MPHLLVEYKEDRLVATVRTEGRSGGFGDYEQGIVIKGKLISDYGFAVVDEYALTGEQKATVMKVNTDQTRPVEDRVQYILELLVSIGNTLLLSGTIFRSNTEVIVVGEFEYPVPTPEPDDGRMQLDQDAPF